MEETLKVDGQEANFPLQCNNNKLQPKLLMEIMDKELQWYKHLKAKEEPKLDKRLVFPVINNSMLVVFPSLKSLLPTLEIDFENYITDMLSVSMYHYRGFIKFLYTVNNKK